MKINYEKKNLTVIIIVITENNNYDYYKDV